MNFTATVSILDANGSSSNADTRLPKTQRGALAQGAALGAAATIIRSS